MIKRRILMLKRLMHAQTTGL